MGLSCCFRTSHLLFLPAVWLGLASIRLQEPRRLLRERVVVGTGFVLGTAPLLMQQYLSFGSPFSSGYGYWVPYWASLTKAFHPSHVGDQLSYLWGEVRQRQEVVTTASFYGLGTYFGPAFVVVTSAVFVRLLRQREWRAPVVAVLSFVAFLLFYFFQEGRLLFPVLVLGATAVAFEAPRWFRDAGGVVRLGLGFLLLGQVSMFPGHRLDPDFER